MRDSAAPQGNRAQSRRRYTNVEATGGTSAAQAKSRLRMIAPKHYLPLILATFDRPSPYKLTCPRCGRRASATKTGNRWACSHPVNCDSRGDVFDAYRIARGGKARGYREFEQILRELVVLFEINAPKVTEGYSPSPPTYSARPKRPPRQSKVTAPPPPVEVRRRIKIIGNRAVRVEES